MFALTYEVAIKNKVLGPVKKHYMVFLFFCFFLVHIPLARPNDPWDFFFLAGWPVVDLSPRSIHLNHNGQSGGWGGPGGSGGGGGGGAN